MIVYILLGIVILFFLALAFETMFGSFFTKPKLRGHKNRLQYYNSFMDMWLDVCGYYDEKHYGTFPCSNMKELESYRRKWKTMRQLKQYMKVNERRHKKEKEEERRIRDNDIY